MAGKPYVLVATPKAGNLAFDGADVVMARKSGPISAMVSHIWTAI